MIGVTGEVKQQKLNHPLPSSEQKWDVLVSVQVIHSLILWMCARTDIRVKSDDGVARRSWQVELLYVRLKTHA